MFRQRSEKLERIDTGRYTDAEYETFLREIRFINRYLGDGRALRKTLIQEIEDQDLREFSVLDVGAGSGELLQEIAKFAAATGRVATLAGLDLNVISISVLKRDSGKFPNIAAVRGDAFRLPFADDSFDYAISSLFFHHLRDEQIPEVLQEMGRVARRGIVAIDLHRRPMACVLFNVFCFAFGISPLVREDGSLSIQRGFRPEELQRYGTVTRSLPYRLALTIEKPNCDFGHISGGRRER